MTTDPTPPERTPSAADATPTAAILAELDGPLDSARLQTSLETFGAGRGTRFQDDGRFVLGLGASHHTITEVEFEDGAWEVEFVMDGELYEVKIDPSDLEIMTTAAGGPGGQPTRQGRLAGTGDTQEKNRPPGAAHPGSMQQQTALLDQQPGRHHVSQADTYDITAFQLFNIFQG